MKVKITNKVRKALIAAKILLLSFFTNVIPKIKIPKLIIVTTTSSANPLLAYSA